MGQKSSRVGPKTPNFADLAARSKFSEEQLKTLYKRYLAVSASVINDNVIDKNEFRQALAISSEGMANRIFSAFDVDNSAGIDFEEFVIGLSGLSPTASIHEKAEFVFRIFDLDRNGYIDRQELSEVLRYSLESNASVSIPNEQLDRVIDATYQQIDGNSDGKISFEEFELAASKNPFILDCVSLNLEVLGL